MTSMSYCRHENTLDDLEQVWDMWDDWDEPNENQYEKRSRKELAELILDMQEAAQDYLYSLDEED